MKVQLIFLDLDGTLTNDEKRITPETLSALTAAQKQGIRLVLASARPAPGLYRECDALSMRDFGGILMSYNGGCITDASSGEVYFKTAMERETAGTVLSLLDDLPLTPILDDGKDFLVRDREGFMVAYECANNCMRCREYPELAEALDFDPVKILFSMQPDELPKLQREIRRRLDGKGLMDLSVVQTAPWYLEVLPAAINKGQGLLDCCRILGVPVEGSLAFGDAENDVPMLRAAGVGVAMGNASEEVKAAADLVTADNNSDGIALALRRFLFP